MRDNVIDDLIDRDDDLNRSDYSEFFEDKLEKIVQFQKMSDRSYIRRRLGLKPLPMCCVPGLRI